MLTLTCLNRIFAFVVVLYTYNHNNTGGTMIKPYNILFLSTGSACRSQIAHGWARWFGRPVYEINSAAFSITGEDRYAAAVMKETGFDISDQHANLVTDEQLRAADIVIALSSDASSQCPELPVGVSLETWNLERPVDIDPSMSEEEKLASYRSLREDIKIRVKALITRLNHVQYENFATISGVTENSAEKLSFS